MNSGIKIVFLLLIFNFPLMAQYKFSSEPEKFIAEVNTMFQNSKSASLLEVGTNFNSVWGNFEDKQRKKIIEISQEMVKLKRFRASHYGDLFGGLAAAKTRGLPSSQLDSILYITQKILPKFDGKQTNYYFTTLRQFLEGDFLYKSSYNTLKISGGTFSFKFMEQKEEEVSYTEAPTDTAIQNQDPFIDWDNAQQATDDWGTIIESEAPSEEVQTTVLDVGYTPLPQPPVEGPVIYLEGVDLIMKTSSDSAVIKGTTCSFLLKNGLLVGTGGKFNWESAGLPPEEPYVEFKEYNFDVKSPKVTAEGVTLNYPSKIDKPVDGVFEFYSKKRGVNAENTYPRFKSFGSNINVKDLGENITYHGGFSLSGQKIYSSSIDEGIAFISIKHEGEIKIKAFSNRFTLGDSLITADISNIVLYQGGTDSIYHPGTIFTFNKNKEILRLNKQPSYRQAPFIDTYHKIEIVADALVWDLNQPRMDFSIINAKDQISATFESEEFFNADKYALMQGIYRFHPLQMIVGYSEKVKSDVFYSDDVAEANKFDERTIRGAMVSLMKSGFIDYNAKTGYIKLRPKAKHYVLSRRDKKDYDNITFVSVSPNGYNATLDLSNHELTVRGVDKVHISDSLSVIFVPEGKEIKIQKNRDFKFNGIINTEAFQFVGKDFQFVYDSFLVHCPTIDAIRMAMKTQGEKNKGKSKSKGEKKIVANELTYSSGTLFINKPNNKSGRKRYVQYPIFDANTGATVVFNKAQVANGAYDSTMQFKIPPFRLDSLSSHDPNTVGFDGEFNSGGIFPSFKERLVVMPDHSLGFVHTVPKDGFQLYEGNGKFYNKITLNNNGLRGEGEIKYLNTTLHSKDFFFMKDSVLTVGTKAITKEGTNAEIEQDVKFPEMVVDNYKLKWIPRSDKMFISDTKEPIQFYNKTAVLVGTANVTSRGMFGEGILQTRGSESESENFHFEQTRFEGREAIFTIQSDNPAKPALLCKNVKLDFSLEKSLAMFQPEVEGFASNEFPYVQYKSSLDNGVWDLKKKTVSMKMPEGGDISKSYFYSTRLEQDSLVFNATEAIYDIPKQSLNIKGIPFIKVADGFVYPDKKEVVVEESAVIQTLHNAKITLDTLDEYHHLINGIIDIKGRKRFEGVATYQYVNLGGDTLTIKFQEFQYLPGERRKEGYHTVAQGLVKEEDSLVIGPRIFYKGKVTMFADKKYLSFDGFLKLDLKGALQFSQWLKYVNQGDSSVIITLDKPTADNGNPLTTGLYFYKGDNEIYPTFISEKKDLSDLDIFETKGILNYDAVHNEFSVGSREKINDNNAKGSLLTYNDSKSTIKYQSRMNFMENNKNIELVTIGTGDGNLKLNQFNFNTFIIFNPKMHISIIDAIGKDISGICKVLPDTSKPEVMETREKALTYKLSEVISSSTLKTLKERKFATYVSLPTISKDFTKGFVFSDVDFKWSHEHKAYYSVGPIFISNILKEDIGKPVTGMIEIKKTATGDAINIYLEPTPDFWYYITYEENRLAVISSSPDVNKEVSKRSKGEMPDQSKFYFVQAQESEKTYFVNHFNEKYNGVKPAVEELTPDMISDDSKPNREKVVDKEEDLTEETPHEEVGQHEDDPGLGGDEELNFKKSKIDKKKAKKYKKNTDNFDENIGKEDEETEERIIKEQDVEQKRQSQKDREKMKSLIGN